MTIPLQPQTATILEFKPRDRQSSVVPFRRQSTVVSIAPKIAVAAFDCWYHDEAIAEKAAPPRH